MARLTPTLLAIATLLASSFAARAASPWPSLATPAPKAGGGEKDVALIISIERYAALPGVAGAEANARAWEVWFEKTRGLRPDRLTWLQDKDGTPANILSKARELAELADPAGTIWVVFIGHGAPSDDVDPAKREGMLIGWAAQQTALELYAQSLRQSDLVAALGGGARAPIRMVLDACFSGLDGSGNALAAGLQPVLLANRTTSPRVSVLSAGTSNQFAGPLPGDARPAFSYLLLGALRGWADDPTYGNHDGQVTIAEAIDFAKAALRATLRGGRAQTPEASGGPAELGSVAARKVTEAAPDLSAIRDAIAPEPPKPLTTTAPPEVGGGAPVGGGLDLSSLDDMEALQQAEELSKRVRRAQALDGDASATPEAKADAWDSVASFQVKGQPSAFAAKARANAGSWRAVAAQRESMRADWQKIKKALGLSVVSLADKLAFVTKFEAAYRELAAEPELKEAARAEAGLRAGKSSPLSEAPRGFVEIPAGQFLMGSPADEEGRDDDESQRSVSIDQAFWLAQTEVTRAQWRSVMGSEPWWFKGAGDDAPVSHVSWYDAVAYLNRLSAREGLTACYAVSGCSGTVGSGCSAADQTSQGWCTGDYRCDTVEEVSGCTGYRLPTEAEWEYAARAGTRTATYAGPLHIEGQNNGPALDPIAWYGGNSGVSWEGGAVCSTWPEKQHSADRCGPHPVAQKRANAWGLYDMLGNVWEWTSTAIGGGRVYRGGGWDGFARGVRAARRSRNAPAFRYDGLGFRPARSIP